MKRAQLAGRTATIQLVVNTVPDQPGTTLKANVTREVERQSAFRGPRVAGDRRRWRDPVLPPRRRPSAAVVSISACSRSRRRGGANPFAAATGNAGPGAPLVTVARHQGGGILHLIPAALLFLALGGVFGLDMLIKSGILKGGIGDVMGSTGPPTGLTGGPDDDLKIDYDPIPGSPSRSTNGSVSASSCSRKRTLPIPDKFKRLTYMEDGSYNNTCVKVDGDEHLYGQAPGDWGKDDKTKKQTQRRRDGPWPQVGLRLGISRQASASCRPS